MLQQPPPQGQSEQALSSKLIVDWSDDIIVRPEEPRESIPPSPRYCGRNNPKNAAQYTASRKQSREREATAQSVLQVDCCEMPQDNQQSGWHLQCPQSWQAILKIWQCTPVDSRHLALKLLWTQRARQESSQIKKPTAHQRHRNNSESVRDKIHTVRCDAVTEKHNNQLTRQRKLRDPRSTSE